MTLPRCLSGRYELGELLGLGGMSEVHLARDLRLHRDVAVKLLRADLASDPDISLRFQREAQHAAALNHPAIAAVYDTGEVETPSGSLPYIVMEYVDGLTLRDIVRADGPMPTRRAIEVIADACQALTCSHERGIIHRDVKPANIMIGTAGAVKMLDFGIAKAIADGERTITQAGAVMGTAQYLSPEQARGVRVDARADVYSLGCVLYEILTGEPPFVGDSSVAVAYQHVREKAVAPSARNSAIAPELDAVVLKAMEKNPDNRYQTAAQLRTDLLRVLRGQAPPPDPDPPTDQMSTASTSPEGGRPIRRWLVAVAVLASVTVVGVTGVNALKSSPRDVTVADTQGQVSTDLPRSDVPDPSAGSVQVTVPDVTSLTYAEAVRVLEDAGFTRFQQASLPSPPELTDRVVGSNPPPNRTTAITNEITIVLGSGPVAAIP